MEKNIINRILLLNQSKCTNNTKNLACYIQLSTKRFYSDPPKQQVEQSVNSDSKPEINGNNKKMSEISETRKRLTLLRWFNDPAIDAATEKSLIKLNPMAMMYASKSDDNSHLIRSSAYLRRELPIRLAHLIKDFRNLPFIVGCNPAILDIHERYVTAFRNMDSFPIEIKDMGSEEKFTQIVQNTLNLNKDILALLAEGFRDTRRYLNNEDTIKATLNRILTIRLATRLLCEHHLALRKQSSIANQNEQSSTTTTTATGSNASISPSDSTATSNTSANSSSSSSSNSDWVGIVNKKFSPKRAIEHSAKMVTNLCLDKYGISPKLKIDGHINARFPYIVLPLEYIIPELLKNAFRATVEHNRSLNNNIQQLPDISVTIAVNERDCIIRIRDRGGGVPHNIVNRIFDYHFTTSNSVNKQQESDDADASFFGDMNQSGNFGYMVDSSHGLSVMHGYGFGLPTSRAYAEYLGGSITFQSLQGIGSDFYLRLTLFDAETGIVRI